MPNTVCYYRLGTKLCREHIFTFAFVFVKSQLCKHLDIEFRRECISFILCKNPRLQKYMFVCLFCGSLCSCEFSCIDWDFATFTRVYLKANRVYALTRFNIPWLYVIVCFMVAICRHIDSMAIYLQQTHQMGKYSCFIYYCAYFIKF